jgi:choline dehydrogenase-like flavoprotein
MTDIVLPDQQPAPGVDLELWARQSTGAAVYAERVCSTSMVPAAYRGKPAEATAAILAGAELGFSPMASLRAFDNIQGVPAPKAMTLRAVVQAAGHEIRVVESTAQRAVVEGRRKGATEWNAPSVWDIERAKKMPQFKSNPNYQHNPAAMLLARATAEQCRWTAADAIMGMPYAAEEIGDHPQLAPSPIARRLTAADLDAEPATPAIEAADGGEPLTDQQRKRMFALWADLGYAGDENRAFRLERTAKILGLTGPLESSSDLTRAEADQVIAALVERKAQQSGGAQ